MSFLGWLFKRYKQDKEVTKSVKELVKRVTELESLYKRDMIDFSNHVDQRMADIANVLTDKLDILYIEDKVK